MNWSPLPLLEAVCPRALVPAIIHATILAQRR